MILSPELPYISVAETCRRCGFCRARFWQIQSERRCFGVRYLNATRAEVLEASVDAFLAQRAAGYAGKYAAKFPAQ